MGAVGCPGGNGGVAEDFLEVVFFTLCIAPCRLPECAMRWLQLAVGWCFALRKAIAEVSPEEAEVCSSESH